jgi:AmmeMemoRadiSam system protein A
MPSPQNDFEKQVIQIAALGVWQIVTGHPMTKRLEPVSDSRWEQKTGLFVTLRKHGEIRGSMGMLESTTTLPETLFDCAQTAATHDKRYPPVQSDEVKDLEVEVTLMSRFQKMIEPSKIKIGETGILVSRGEKQAVLLPQVAVDQKWSAEQFLEACCEKAQLSHKAWKDPNTLVEIFSCLTIVGGSLLKVIQDFI